MAEEFLHQILEPMAVGIGPNEPGCGASAIKRRCDDAEIGLHNSNVESREMIEFESVRVGQQAF